MVAASGEVGAISPARGLLCLGVIVLALLAVIWMSQRTTLPSFVPLDTFPAVAVDRARSLLRDLGFREPPVDTASGHEVDRAYLQYLVDKDPSPARWEVLRTGRPPAITRWCRR